MLKMVMSMENASRKAVECSTHQRGAGSCTTAHLRQRHKNQFKTSEEILGDL